GVATRFSSSDPASAPAHAPAPPPARVIRPPPRSASRPYACIGVYCGPIDAAARRRPPTGCDGGGVLWAERGWLRCVVTATGGRSARTAYGTGVSTELPDCCCGPRSRAA